MTLQMWLARLLQHAQAARCVHGLADKLQETSDAAESVAFLAAELARKCPGRRTLLALRRNLMIWWDRNKFLTQWTEMEATFQQALLFLQMPAEIASGTCDTPAHSEDGWIFYEAMGHLDGMLGLM